MCAQVGEILTFLATADPIAERELLIDETISQLGEDFDVDALLDLSWQEAREL